MYALAFDSGGRLLAGTGNRGHVFAITGEDRFVDLLKASATQVTAFAKAPAGGLYVSTSNLGKVFLLGGSAESEGSYESDVFDAKVFSRWGRAELRGAGQVQLFARSGNVDNPDRNWSPWQPVDLVKDPVLNVPPARFIQWKAVLHAGTTAPTRGQCAAELPAQERRSGLRRCDGAGGRALPAHAQARAGARYERDRGAQIRSRASTRLLLPLATPIPSA